MRALIGCAASRCSVTAFIAWAMLSLSAGVPSSTAEVKMKPGGGAEWR